MISGNPKLPGPFDRIQISSQQKKQQSSYLKYEFTVKNQSLFAQNIDQYQILNQIRDFNPAYDTQLTLRNVQIKQISPLLKQELEKYSKLATLNLANLNLRSLNNFPNLPYLETLNLTSNLITDKWLPKIMELYPNLLELILRKNKIKCQKSFDQFQTSQIQELDLRDNQISNRQFTSEYMFDKIKSLMIFDGKYKDGKRNNKTPFDQQLEDCLSEKSSVDFNNPDSDEQQQKIASKANANYWYQPKATRNLRYLKNVDPIQKLRMKKRKSPYYWNRSYSQLKKQEKMEKLQNKD